MIEIDKFAQDVLDSNIQDHRLWRLRLRDGINDDYIKNILGYYVEDADKYTDKQLDNWIVLILTPSELHNLIKNTGLHHLTDKIGVLARLS